LMGPSGSRTAVPTLQSAGQAAFQAHQPLHSTPLRAPTSAELLPSNFDTNSAFEDAVAFSPLVATSSAFPPAHSPSFDTFSASSTSHPSHSLLDSPYTFQPATSHEMSRLPDLSSSTGSTASTASVRTVDSMASPRTTNVPAVPTAAASPVVKQRQAEQDFFSSVFGSATRCVYSSVDSPPSDADFPFLLQIHRRLLVLILDSLLPFSASFLVSSSLLFP
jgi:hypothetical protein